MGFRLQLQIGWDKHNHICGQTNTIPHLLPGTLVGVQNKFLLVLRLAQWYLLAPPQMGLTWWFSVICEEGKYQSLHKCIFYLDKRIRGKLLMVLRLARWYLLAPPQMGLNRWFRVICEEGNCRSLHRYCTCLGSTVSTSKDTVGFHMC